MTATIARVGYAFSLGRLSDARVMALAAAAPAGSTDPVDLALAEALQAQAPDLQTPTVDPDEYEPASPERRYSLARIHDFCLDPKQESVELVVMRGEFKTVMKHISISREHKSVAMRNAHYADRKGRRPLAVAIARVDESGHVGHFHFEGFVTVRTETMLGVPHGMAARPATWVRINVWSASLRFQHWINVAAVFILSCTGYYMMDPFFGPAAHAGGQTGYLMGWVRLIHFCTAFIWIIIGLTRLVLAGMSRDPYLRWGAFWPLKSKQDLRHLKEVLLHYSLIRKHAPLYLAHNPLQQLTYTAIYLLCGLQMATGLTLFGLYQQENWFWRLTAIPTHWVGIPFVRLVHTMIMFFLWVFVVIHVYLAVRADSLERHGGISSMINGGVWLHKGSRPVDAPEIE